VAEGYLLEEFGPLRLDAVTPDLIDAYRERQIKEGKLSNRTIVRHLTVLHGIFKRAKRVWGLADNPASADLVERPKVTYTGEFDTFDRDEIERLVVAAEDEQDAAIYKVAAFTGLRQGELLALRWSDVDFMDGLLHVRRSFTGGQEKVPKGKRVRSVPMMPAVIDALANLKDRQSFTKADDLVFTREGEHLNHFDLGELQPELPSRPAYVRAKSSEDACRFPAVPFCYRRAVTSGGVNWRPIGGRCVGSLAAPDRETPP